MHYTIRSPSRTESAVTVVHLRNYLGTCLALTWQYPNHLSRDCLMRPTWLIRLVQTIAVVQVSVEEAAFTLEAFCSVSIAFSLVSEKSNSVPSWQRKDILSLSEMVNQKSCKSARINGPVVSWKANCIGLWGKKRKKSMQTEPQWEIKIIFCLPSHA